MSWCFIVHGDRWRVWLGVVLHGSCTEFVAVVALVCQIMVTYGIRGRMWAVNRSAVVHLLEGLGSRPLGVLSPLEVERFGKVRRSRANSC